MPSSTATVTNRSSDILDPYLCLSEAELKRYTDLFPATTALHNRQTLEDIVIIAVMARGIVVKKCKQKPS